VNARTRNVRKNIVFVGVMSLKALKLVDVRTATIQMIVMAMMIKIMEEELGYQQ